MVYETDLLEPMWWVNSLLGSSVMLVVLIELWALSYIRRIPNIKGFSFMILGMNALLIIFAIFAGEGLTIAEGLLVFIMAIFGYIAFSGYGDS